MRRADRLPPRLRSAAVAVAVQLLLVAALVYGIGDAPASLTAPTLRMFAVAHEAPRIVPPPPRTARPAGRAAPPAKRAQAAAIVAPPPLIPLVVPPPVAAATIAGTGGDASQGAAVAGPGSGAGGVGNGTGSGGSGIGDGSGDIPLRKIKGRIRAADLPDAMQAAGVSGTVYMRFTVGIDGRVRDCIVTATSGNPGLDEVTCRLITERFRYKPTRTASGRPVPDTVIGEQHWETAWRDPPAEPPLR